VSRILGIVILLFAIAGGLLYALVQRGSVDGMIGTPPPKQVALMGFVGGEKLNLMEDPEVKEILAHRYGITLDLRRAGSVEMVMEQRLLDQKPQFLWPSSQVVAELAKERGLGIRKDEIIFNSPIVLYTWSPIASALEAKGLAAKQADGHYSVKLPELLDKIVHETSWADIGVDALYGRMMLFSTDPTKSNSGFMFAGLLANVLNGGEIVGDNSVGQVLPTIKRLFERMGYMEPSSGQLFDTYIEQGMGAKPIIVGYENQLVEYALAHKDKWPSVQAMPIHPVVLYAEPTVYSSHPLMTLAPEADALITALQDADLQRLAWEHHGFRSGFVGVINDPAGLGIAGLSPTIAKVMPMPSPRTMTAILAALQGGPDVTCRLQPALRTNLSRLHGPPPAVER